MKTIPKYIGHPGYMANADGFHDSDYGDSVNDAMDSSLQIAKIVPMDTQISKSINIYQGKNAWEEYVKYLEAHDISPGVNNGYINVVCSQITPLSETYTNEFGQSELAGGLQSIMNGKMAEVAFATGWNSDTIKNASQKDGVIGWLAAGADKGIGVLGDLMGSFAGDQNRRDFEDFARNPAQKIDIPSMWKGNSFSAQYELSIRLYCYNVNNDDEYNSKIVASLGAILQFVCPRSKQGKFYQWPFLMSFKIPGLVDLPLAYCSNLTVLKGGDVNDLSWKYRPNMVDLRMTINTVWGVTVNSFTPLNDSSRPTVLHELQTLSTKKNSESQTPVRKGNSNPTVKDESDNPLDKRYKTNDEEEDAVNALTGNNENSTNDENENKVENNTNNNSENNQNNNSENNDNNSENNNSENNTNNNSGN